MSNRIPAIDGLRGLAILMVIYQHCYATGVVRALESVTSAYPVLITNGWMGVGLFFVISGFVLALPFENGSRPLQAKDDYADFMLRRLHRLWPMLAIGAGVGFVYLTATEGPKLKSFLLTVTTLSMFTRDQFFPDVFPVGWSLMVEVWASALLPLVILAARRYGWVRVVLIVMALSLAVRLLGTQQTFINFHVRPLKDSVLGRLDDFVIGAWIAHLYAAGRLPRGRSGMMAIAGILSAFVLADLCTSRVAPQILLAFVNNAAQIGFGFAIITALRPGALAAILTFWPLQLAGAMSYSLYVWHAFVRGPQFMAQPFDYWLNVSFWIPFLILSAVTYKFVEFPRTPAAKAFRFGNRG